MATFKELLHQATLLSSQKKLVDAQNVYKGWLQTWTTNETKELDAETKSNLSIAYNNLGQLKYLQVDFDGAMLDYNKALSYDSSLASAYYNRGTIYYRMGNYSAALEDMKIATSLQPDNEEFQIGLTRSKIQTSSKNNGSSNYH